VALDPYPNHLFGSGSCKKARILSDPDPQLCLDYHIIEAGTLRHTYVFNFLFVWCYPTGTVFSRLTRNDMIFKSGVTLNLFSKLLLKSKISVRKVYKLRELILWIVCMKKNIWVIIQKVGSFPWLTFFIKNSANTEHFFSKGLSRIKFT